MSNVTMQKIYDAAKAFVADVEQLPALIEAIKEHRTAEVAETAPEPAAEPDAPTEPEPTP